MIYHNYSNIQNFSKKNNTMSPIRFFVSLAVLLANVILCQAWPPKLILISMDGLMYRFIDEVPTNMTENFQYLIRNGVLHKRLNNLIPSETYPSHYTIITGLYPESHGIVADYFYDPELDDFYDPDTVAGNVDSKWYDVGAEPIYVTNTNAGDGRCSGTVLFPTSLATVKGVAPDVKVELTSTAVNSMSNTERIDTLIGWLTDEHRPINLGLIYFPEPDNAAHLFGVTSDEVKNQIMGPLDTALGYLISKLRQNHLLNDTNIILTADNGLVDLRNFIFLDDYINPATYTTAGQGRDNVVTGILPEAGFENEIFRNLSSVTGIRVYRRGAARLQAMNYSDNARISPIVVVADIGIVIVKNQAAADAYPYVGVNGYDPDRYSQMRPVFIGSGPSFKKNYKSRLDDFSTLDLYPLMCHLLCIHPAPNNGSIDNLLDFLAENGQGQTVAYATMVFGEQLRF